ncbi:putative disease resistance RPP13-like protein 1, partial [Mucuna pruriens]
MPFPKRRCEMGAICLSRKYKYLNETIWFNIKLYQRVVIAFLKIMAKSLLFSFAESLIGKLASLHDLQDMKESMALIKALLLDAEEKKLWDNTLSEWLRQNKHVSLMPKTVDDFECKGLRKHVVNEGNNKKKLKEDEIIINFRLLHKLLSKTHEIKDINKRLDKVAAQRNMFGLQLNDQDTRVVHVREMTHSYVNPSNVIGREDDKQKIIKLLLQDRKRNCEKVCRDTVGSEDIREFTILEV